MRIQLKTDPWRKGLRGFSPPPYDKRMNGFSVKGKVEVFPQEGGWVYVRVPERYTEMTRGNSVRGLVAITATTGKTSWKTSLLLLGDGTHFIALKAKVREAENIRVGDAISLSFRLR